MKLQDTLLPLLAVETSGKACSTALLTKEGLFEEFLPDAGTHSSALFPLIEKVLQKAGISREVLASYAVSRGPGSFTGIRIGIAAVKGLSWGQERPACGISSLESAVWASEAKGQVLSLIDARHGSFYFALFQEDDGKYIRLSEDHVALGEEILSLLPPLVTLCGEGAPAFAALFPDRTFIVSNAVASARGIALAAENCGASAFGSAGLLEAEYLRPSQAERLRKEK